MAKIGSLVIDRIHFSSGVDSGYVKASNSGSLVSSVSVVVPNPENKPVQLIFEGHSTATHSASGQTSGAIGQVLRTRAGAATLYYREYPQQALTSGTENFDFRGSTIDMTAQDGDTYTLQIPTTTSSAPNSPVILYQVKSITAFYAKR